MTEVKDLENNGPLAIQGLGTQGTWQSRDFEHKGGHGQSRDWEQNGFGQSMEFNKRGHVQSRYWKHFGPWAIWGFGIQGAMHNPWIWNTTCHGQSRNSKHKGVMGNKKIKTKNGHFIFEPFIKNLKE